MGSTLPRRCDLPPFQACGHPGGARGGEQNVSSPHPVRLWARPGRAREIGLGEARGLRGRGRGALCENRPALWLPPRPPEVTLSSSRKMGTMMKMMMSRVWIMMMPSFSVFRRFSCAKVLNPGRGWDGVGEAGRCRRPYVAASLVLG